MVAAEAESIVVVARECQGLKNCFGFYKEGKKKKFLDVCLRKEHTKRKRVSIAVIFACELRLGNVCDTRAGIFVSELITRQ